MLPSHIATVIFSLQVVFAIDQAPVETMDSWSVHADSKWDVLGPFPIHAREQHYLSPAFPLNLSQAIDYEYQWPSSYADNGMVSWTTATMVANTLKVSFPEIRQVEARWAYLRATEGWAGLQHHAILRTTLTIHPPGSAKNEPLPLLSVSLKQGSYFTLRPQEVDLSSFVPEWHPGNIYDLENALPTLVHLPLELPADKPTKFDLFVGGDYEIRLFGDPRVQGGEIPTLQLGIGVSLKNTKEPRILLQPSQNVKCDFVAGYAFGDSIGIGIQSLSGWWKVVHVTLQPPVDGIELVLAAPTLIAPTQTRTVPILIKQTKSLSNKNDLSFEIVVESDGTQSSLALSLPIVHHESLVQKVPKNVIQATYMSQGTAPLAFLAMTPSMAETSEAGPPFLALHGAGVDVLEAHKEMWVNALPQRKRSWVVIATGRTSWGLDWHGPSARDAWDSLDALQEILHRFRGEEVPTSFTIPKHSKAVVIGHSNGGQGTWHLASRYPDRVLAAVPAAAYSKSQAYIPLTLARNGHFIDPILRAILESSLTPDDNDLHVSNLVDVELFAIHGGSDENVPVWHTREMVGDLRAWYPGKDFRFKEDPGQGHWYPDVFNNPVVEAFLDNLTSAGVGADRPSTDTFTLTTANPQECGPLRGWKIEETRIPGRLARMTVRKVDTKRVQVETVNVRRFRITNVSGPLDLEINGKPLLLTGHDIDAAIVDFGFDDWQKQSSSAETKSHGLPPGRIQAILSSSGLLSIVISDNDTHQLSGALRIAHILKQYHQLDAEIVTEAVALKRSLSNAWGQGNVISLAQPTSSFIKEVLRDSGTPVKIDDGGFSVSGRRFTQIGQALISTQPHQNGSIMLLLLYNGPAGLERALRLFPFRTGVAVPDWVVVGDGVDKFGAAGVVAAGLWTSDWQPAEPMTWFYQ